MAKKKRNRRSARQARAEKRQQSVGAPTSDASAKGTSSKSVAKRQEKKKAEKKPKGKRGGPLGYLADVRTEMRRVTWPSRTELRNYSMAVIVSLIIVGVFVWAVDTGFLALLAWFTGLRG